MNIQMRIDGKEAQNVPFHERAPATLISTLKQIWARRRLVGALTLVGAILIAFALTLSTPIYTSEATLELNFNREETVNTTVSRQLASMDPGALVNGAARQINSRGNASNVVQRFGLANAIMAKQSSFFSKLFGRGMTPAKAHEIAIEDLLRKLVVTYKAHLYIIGIAYSHDDPVLAAQMANAVAIEYLRGERIKDLQEQRSVAIKDFESLSDKLGELHPRRAQAKARIERFDLQIASVDKSAPVASNFLLGGQYLTLAEPVLVPQSQKRAAVFLVGLAIVLALAAALALYINLRLAQAAPTPRWLQVMASLDKST